MPMKVLSWIELRAELLRAVFVDRWRFPSSWKAIVLLDEGESPIHVVSDALHRTDGDAVPAFPSGFLPGRWSVLDQVRV
jgi:hypothetical protein